MQLNISDPVAKEIWERLPSINGWYALQSRHVHDFHYMVPLVPAIPSALATAIDNGKIYEVLGNLSFDESRDHHSGWVLVIADNGIYSVEFDGVKNIDSPLRVDRYGWSEVELLGLETNRSALNGDDQPVKTSIVMRVGGQDIRYTQRHANGTSPADAMAVYRLAQSERQ